MKKIVLLALLPLMFFSCSVDNDLDDFYFEIMPIESVDIPESFVFGQTYEISVTYDKLNTCHSFYDFIYEINENERTIAVVDIVSTNMTCEDEEELVTVSFNFTVSSFDTYLFKFYQGEDEDGVDQYHLIEVPVGMGFTNSEIPNVTN